MSDIPIHTPYGEQKPETVSGAQLLTSSEARHIKLAIGRKRAEKERKLRRKRKTVARTEETPATRTEENVGREKTSRQKKLKIA